MDTITLTYQGQTSRSTPARGSGSPRTSRRCPQVTSTNATSASWRYARDVLTGHLPGPYDDDAADCFARR